MTDGNGDNGAPEAISEEGVRRVAHLCRLALSDEEIAASTKRLTVVLEYVDRLRELDLTSIEPLNNPMDATSRVDLDEPRPGLPNAALMKMAPGSFPPFIKVPKVLGEGGGA